MPLYYSIKIRNLEISRFLIFVINKSSAKIYILLRQILIKHIQQLSKKIIKKYHPLLFTTIFI